MIPWTFQKLNSFLKYTSSNEHFKLQLPPSFKLQNYFHIQHIHYHSNPGGNINRIHVVAIYEWVEARLRWETLTSFPHIRILSNYIKIFYWLWCHTHASQCLKIKQACSLLDSPQYIRVNTDKDFSNNSIGFVWLFWFFTSQSTVFKSCRARSSWVEPVLSRV